MLTNDKRFPTNVYRQGYRVRDVTRDELRTCGFNEAEVHTLWLSLTQPHAGDPLTTAAEGIVGAKVVNNWPKRPHEMAWLASQGMTTAKERYYRCGREKFLRLYPSNGQQIEKWILADYKPTYEEFFGVKA